MAAAFLLLFFGLSGCSLYSGVMPPALNGEAVTKVENVPFYAQDEYECGPAAMAMVLTYNGLDLTPDDLVDEVYTPERKGSLQPDMITAARRHGFVGYEIKGPDALSAELAAGRPVIVLQNLGLSWYPVWHYAVVLGLDHTTDEVILHSGETANKRTPYRVFENTWGSSDFWGLLVVPPATLPATAEELPWLTSVVGLERVKDWEGAAQGYEVATRRWPDSHDAWIGLGNTRYALGDKPGAAAAFQRATEAKPDSGIAFNNLAVLLNELGRHDEALKAAKTAVSIGGPLIETFKATLKEIEG